MNKTIIININGIVFHIEEDAYEVLKNYMTDVKRHFLDSADSLEITTDIENRIAEMFTEILNAESKQVIVEQDVHKVISQMGTVEDFASADEDESTATGSAYQYKSQSRRLFRDSDDHLIGGVCAGIANYFDLSPVMVRLAFAIAFCLWGSGLFLYIILWIVIPKAVTRADRMAMKGEPLDLQGFKRNFEDELKNVQGHAANLHKEVKPLIYKTRDFAGDFFDHFRAFLSGAGRVMLKLLGIVMMLTCIGCTIALIVSLFAYFAYDKHGIYNVFPFSMLNYEYSVPFMTGSFLCLAIPLLALTLVSVRLIFDRVVIHRSAGLTMLLLWVVSLCVVIYYSVQVAAEFRSEGKISQTVNIKPAPGNVYHLQLNDVRYLSSEDSASLDIKHSFVGKIIVDDENDYNNDEDDNGSPRSVNITIERSDVPQPVLVETFSARGSNYTNALLNAKNIFYRFTQKDSLLTFDRRIQHLEKHSWRDQEVFLTLKIPANTELVIDEKLDRYLDGINIGECQNRTLLEHSHTAPFMMTDSGLVCAMPKPDSVLLQEKNDRRDRNRSH